MNSPRAVSVASLLLFLTWSLSSPVVAQEYFAGRTDVQVGAAEPNSPPSWYGEGVRPTEPRTPSEEQAGFHLPPGFEIRLFAAEPQIAKPMNLAFDHRGRVWVTNSLEYPYGAAEGKTPSDSVHILEDTNGDGRADVSVEFADGLNIPIGVLPYGDGCLCYSIPNIYYLRDTDGDGICDQREVVLGPFDTTRDTHGMINSLRMGKDGWVYANHGFNNQSTVAGSDGHEIVMHSGNTFRFRPDGSRVEHITWGQVNPFGRTSDDWGNDFTADCHSKPISQMVRGGYYPSFGRPDDGLGMIPPMMDHLHGSTAISGLVFLSETLGLPSLANQMLSGNVMTSRINRNAVSYHGATAVAREMPDFLTSDDPWFRPVDIRLGPDGHLYVADFYNRIIGHYEVPLDHPGRDRYRGRIWQIRALDSPDPTGGELPITADIVQSWNSPNPTVRSLALQYAVEHPAPSHDRKARELIRVPSENAQNARITATWYLLQRGLLDIDLLEQVAGDPSPRVRSEGCRAISAFLGPAMVGTRPMDRDSLNDLVIGKLRDDNAHVRGAAAEVLGTTGLGKAIVPLVELLATVDSNDPILRQTTRIALRNLARSQTDFDMSLQPITQSMTGSQQRAFADIMLAVPTPVAADFLLEFLSRKPIPSPEAVPLMQHIIGHASSDRFDAVIDLAKQISKDRPILQRSLGNALVDIRRDRGQAIPQPLRDWIDEHVQFDLQQLTSQLTRGQPLSIAWRDDHGDPWPTQTRRSDDADLPLMVISSFPLGESYTGELVSSPFACPAQISFRIAGHNRHPNVPDSGLNRMELVDLKTGQVLQSAAPPRRDAAVTVRWDCHSWQGSSVFLRCIDGDAGAAYAWIAFGAFDPAWLDETDESLDRTLTAITRYRMLDRRADLVELLRLVARDRHSQALIAAHIAELDQNQPLARLLRRATELSIDLPLIDDWIFRAAEGNEVDEVQQTAALAQHLSTSQQTHLAVSLGGDAQTVPLLVKLAEDGVLAPEVLLEKTVWEPMQTIADASLLERAGAVRGRAKPIDAATEQSMLKIGNRLANFRGDLESGRTLFTEHCALCHQLGGQGELVGPQLDSVGSRSVSRLLEDIMVPDRNVDKAFRTTTFLTIDGRVIHGLVRDENEVRVSVLGPENQVQNIPIDQIELRREAATSLMPSNLPQTVGDDVIAEIIHYLQHTAVQ